MTMTSSTWTRDGARPDASPHPTVHPMLLEEKLAVPEPVGPIVHRPRLLDLLAAATRRRVTTLIAPAGSGKTALLSSWISQAWPPEQVTWVSLDHFDNDPDVFFACLGAALRQAATSSANAAAAGACGRSDDGARGLVEALFDI